MPRGTRVVWRARMGDAARDVGRSGDVRAVARVICGRRNEDDRTKSRERGFARGTRVVSAVACSLVPCIACFACVACAARERGLDDDDDDEASLDVVVPTRMPPHPVRPVGDVP
jgi:hypothetical protein